MNKPLFDPNQPFQAADKPPFDPNQPFEEGSQDQNPSFLGNVGADIKNIARSGMEGAQFMANLGPRAVQSGVGVAQGKPILETPTAEDVASGGSMIANIPGSLIERGKELGIGELATGHPFRAAGKFGAAFHEKPVTTAMDALAVAAPMFRAAGGPEILSRAISRPMAAMAEGTAGKLTNLAQNIGTRSRGVNTRLFKKPQDIALAKADTQIALDTGIMKPFSSAEEMLATTTDIQTGAGQRIGAFLRSQNERLNWGSLLDDLEQLKRDYPADPDVIGRIDNAKEIVRRTAIRNGGEISFEEANKIKGYIQSKVPWNSDAASADVAKRAAGTIRGNLDTQLENIASKSGKVPGYQEFRGQKETFGAAERINKGLFKRYSSEQGKAIGLRETALGAAELAGTGNPLKAVGVMGLFKMGARYGGQTLAFTADKVAKILRRQPEAFGKYAPALENAAAQGTEALAAINDSLQRTDPEYKTLVGRLIQIPTKSKRIFKKAG